jgi:hypothetical protein
MTAERFDETPDDAALEREIRALLAVDPSPQFHARVSSRIARNAAGPSRRAFWLWPGAAALATLVVLLAVVWRPAPPTPQNRRPPTLAASGSVGLVPSVLAPAPAMRRLVAGALAVSGRTPPRTARVTRERTPEILLAPDETRALRALIAGVRDGRIDLTGVTQATTPDVMDLEPIRNLVIAPIVIAPLEGVHQ